MFIDPGGDNVHIVFNPSSSEEAVVVATFTNAPEKGALTLPMDDDESVRLEPELREVVAPDGCVYSFLSC